MEQIFKKGDRVFCYNFGGWGTVSEVLGYHLEFRIRCSFPVGSASFTSEGRFYNDGPPILSFTEYTLEGFSQERPEPLPKKGQIVWVRDWEGQSWFIAHYVQKSKDGYYVTHRDPLSIHLNGSTYKYLTTKNPYANEQ